METRMIWELDDNQRDAVESSDSAVMVVAGPGTGKTRVLTSRIAHLVLNQSVDPSRILAITYTNRAAGEMRDRLASIENSPRSPSEVYVSTFHSYAYRLVRNHAEILGFDREPIVFDEEATDQLIRRILAFHRIPEEYLPVRYIRNLIDEVKSRVACPISGAKIDKEHRENANEIFRDYQSELQIRGALDFSDILLNALRLLICHTEIASEISSKIDHLLIDEFQDINAAQYLLVQALWRDGMKIFSVGDEDQTIYAFRGSSGDFIDRYIADFGATMVTLGNSYRCSRSMLFAAGSLIKHNKRHYQLPPDPPSDISKNQPVFLFELEDEEEEAKLIARQVRGLVEQGSAYRDIAILYRVHSLADEIERVLIDAGIPTMRVAPDKERSELPGDPTPFLRLAVSDTEWDWERAIGLPRDRLGELDDLRLRIAALRQNKPLDKIIANPSKFPALSPLARYELSRISSFVSELRKKSKSEAPSMLINSVVTELQESRSPWSPEQDNFIRIEENNLTGFDNFVPGAILESFLQSSRGIRIVFSPYITAWLASRIVEIALREILKVEVEKFPVPDKPESLDDTKKDSRPVIFIGVNHPANLYFPDEILLSQAVYIHSNGISMEPPEQNEREEKFGLTLSAHRFVSELVGFRPDNAAGEQIVFFDLETTGTNITHSEIVEIAAIRVHLKAGQIFEAGQFHSLVKPMNSIPQAVSEIHGITDEDVKNAPPAKDVLQKFLDFIGDSPLAGHNIENFDYPILKRWVGLRLGKTIPNLTLDTLPMSRRLFPDRPHRLGELAKFLGVPLLNAHRALDDVRMNIGVFQKMLDIDESMRARAFSSELPAILALANALDESSHIDPVPINIAASVYYSLFRGEPSNVPLVNSISKIVKPDTLRKIYSIVKSHMNARFFISDEDMRMNQRIDFLRNAALRLEDENPKVSLTEFLAHVAMLSESDVDLPEDAVRMMTIHAVKGLEFDRVFITGLEQGNFPHRLALNKSVNEIEEERRLLFVGLTRAKTRAFLTYTRRRYGKWRFPSMFLTEIPRKAMKKMRSKDRIRT